MRFFKKGYLVSMLTGVISLVADMIYIKKLLSSLKS